MNQLPFSGASRRLNYLYLSVNTFFIMRNLVLAQQVRAMGTIYRYRYGYLMLLVAIGAAAFKVWLSRNKTDTSIDGDKYV